MKVHFIKKGTIEDYVSINVQSGVPFKKLAFENKLRRLENSR